MSDELNDVLSACDYAENISGLTELDAARLLSAAVLDCGDIIEALEPGGPEYAMQHQEVLRRYIAECLITRARHYENSRDALRLKAFHNAMLTLSTTILEQAWSSLQPDLDLELARNYTPSDADDLAAMDHADRLRDIS